MGNRARVDMLAYLSQLRLGQIILLFAGRLVPGRLM